MKSGKSFSEKEGVSEVGGAPRSGWGGGVSGIFSSAVMGAALLSSRWRVIVFFRASCLMWMSVILAMICTNLKGWLRWKYMFCPGLY